MATKTAIRKDQQKQRQSRRNLILTLAAILIALFFGTIQFWYAYQTKLRNRPNLGVQATLSKPFTPGQPMTLVAVIKNFGNAEAHDVNIRSTLVAAPVKTDQEAYDLASLLFNGQPDTRAILAPSESIQQTLISPHPLLPEHYPDVMNGKIKVYFFSQISYLDASGKKHGRAVCQYFDPATSLMTLCFTHNSSF